jgi:DNA-binding LytR/AlgR family response regulator
VSLPSPTPEIESDAGLRVLVVDDEAPARADLEFMLRRQLAIASVGVAADATEALRLLQADQYDAVFLDVRMPGLDGIELGKLLLRFSDPPIVIFVTAHESHAVAAFEAHARGYLLKPVSNERLSDAVNLIWESRRSRRERPVNANANEAAVPPVHDMASVPVESGGRTLLVDRGDVCWIQANGDYVRLHTVQGSSHLVRLPLALFEERWAAHGFVRIHRSHLVALRYVAEVRTGSAGGAIVRVAGQDLAVSRRHTPELKHRLFRVPLAGQ